MKINTKWEFSSFGAIFPLSSQNNKECEHFVDFISISEVSLIFIVAKKRKSIIPNLSLRLHLEIMYESKQQNFIPKITIGFKHHMREHFP